MRVLVVEDEKDLNSIITKKLSIEGYSVDQCFDGEEALSYLHVVHYDIVILDIMMPKINGLQVIQHLRNQNDSTPILLLTAKDSIQDRVEGLDQGADDYLTKPFDFNELMARIRVLTRRNVGSVHNVYKIADLVVDTTKHIVTRNDKLIELSAKEFSLLLYLIQNKGVVLSREKIEEHVWNFDYEGGSNVVDVYIRYLRKKIDNDYQNKLIQTIRGYGYVLREES